ncbi:MAG: DUF1553 domain-containing protein [Verrucomicrobia bacterium]|nr:DUF1553 domain-containing protein [Verrucomicrobiota bacterium]
MKIPSFKYSCFNAVLTLAVLPMLVGHAVYGETPQQIPQKIVFNRDIRPILSDACFHCHGRDEHERKGELRLDTSEGAHADLDGRFAIVDGRPLESELFKRIMTQDEDDIMPPSDSHKKPLTKHQVALVKKWIEQGAEYQGHWAFIKPVRPAVPTSNWAQQASAPLDHFIHSGLQERGLKPSPRADKRTLIRRLSLDLTGLPPSEAEINDFLQDDSANVYNDLVEYYLKSDRYGEHRARYWLDASRYGDTHGLHFDNYREIWPYRDWVINAYNKNLPFDEFTRDCLAGDMVPSATLDQKVASGFNRCNVTFTVKNEEFYTRYAIDRIKTTSTVWLGLTLGCVQCHDHKYDPITMKDFYQMFSFFNNITEKAETAVIGAGKEPPPTVQVPSEVQRVEMKVIQQEVSLLEKQLQERKNKTNSEFKAWLSSRQKNPRQLGALSKELVFHMGFEGQENQGDVSVVEGRIGNALEISGKTNRSVPVRLLFEDTLEFSYGAWIKLPKTKEQAGIVISSMKDNRGCELSIDRQKPTFRIANSFPENAIKVTAKKDLPRGRWQHVFVTYDGSSKAKGVRIYINGKSAPLVVAHDTLKNTIVDGADISIRAKKRESDHASNSFLDELRIYDSSLDESDVKVLYQQGRMSDLLSKTDKTLNEEELVELNDYYLKTGDGIYQGIHRQFTQAQSNKQKLNKKIPTTMVMEENTKRVKFSYILERGQFDKKGEKVFSDTPAFLPAMAKGLPKNRLGLAQWLTSADNPLTARVTVNRIWQEFFGTGIVETSEDFGTQGSWPSHPDLLDWLAVEFIESGWDVKGLIRTIVKSSTYRQSSKISPAALQIDPQNRLLARAPRYRLDAEMIRDQALFVSDLLVEKVGGPGVRPYQPEGLWKAVAFVGSNTGNFKQDHGSGLYRRSLYTFWKKTSPPPSMSLFDAPTREDCIVRRERTNTPLQALNLMNDIQYVEAARQLASRMLKEGGESDDDKIRYGFLLCTATYPDEAALRVLKTSLQKFLSVYRNRPEEAGKLISVGESITDTKGDDQELAAWTMIANTILNLNFVITTR